MNYIKKIYKPYLFSIIFILISIFLVTILNYINILNYNLNMYAKFIIIILSFFIGNYKIGKISTKKGWLEGTKFSIFLLIPMFLITFIIKDFNYKSLIFYSILLISGIIGSMFGISKKKND